MGPGSAPADRGPTLRVPSGDSQAIEPPPAPTVTTSIIGIFEGYSPTEPSVVSAGWPSMTTVTSVEVPPPSQVRTRSKPASPATSAAPRAPAAGPDRTVVIGWCTTSSAESTPPLDFMTYHGTPPVAVRHTSCSRLVMLATYDAIPGLTAASTSVVTARSYSRYSRS